jgi:hypothetical protein
MLVNDLLRESRVAIIHNLFFLVSCQFLVVKGSNNLGKQNSATYLMQEKLDK